MERTKDKKNILIGSLIAIILIMSVGFATASSVLTINASGTSNANWSILFQSNSLNLIEKTTGVVITSTTIDATKKIASLEATFTQPGDYAEYSIIVENTGNIDAYLSGATLTKKNGQENNSNNIKFSYSISNTSGGTVYESGSMTGENETIKTVDNAGTNATLVKTIGTHYITFKLEYLASATAVVTGESAAYSLQLNYEQAPSVVD